MPSHRGAMLKGQTHDPVPASSRTSSDCRPPSRWILLALCIPPIISLAILYWQAFAAPLGDDFYVILAFSCDYQELPTWSSKLLSVITQQANEYKLVLEHLILAAELETTGHVSFGFLVALGDLFLLPIAWLLWRTNLTEEGGDTRALLLFLPVIVLLFSLSYWETLNWAMAALQNLPVIFFSLLSFKLLIPGRNEKNSRSLFYPSCGAAVLAALSSANGFLLAPIGAVVVFRRKGLTAAALWCAPFMLPLMAYMYRYSHVPRPPVPFLSKVIAFFAVLGCAIPNGWVAAALGLTLSGVFIISIFRGFALSHPISFYFTVWVLLCVMVVAWVRGGYTSRYSIYSVLILIYAYKFLITSLPNRLRWLTFKAVYTVCLICACILYVSADTIAWRELGNRKQMVLNGLDYYLVNPQVNSPLIDPAVIKALPYQAEYDRVVLLNAMRRGLYKPRPHGAALQRSRP